MPLNHRRPVHPAVLAHQRQRAADRQLRLADAITAFAGSMPFVYVHVVGFALWMLVFEVSPWPRLTLVVSLEAIFLSTFVMIGQNRQAAFAQAKADHDFREQELELKRNTELTERIHALVARELACRDRRPLDCPGAQDPAEGDRGEVGKGPALHRVGTTGAEPGDVGPWAGAAAGGTVET